MDCPLMQDAAYECNKDCAWYCDGEKCCAVKLIALQLIKLEETQC